MLVQLTILAASIVLPFVCFRAYARRVASTNAPLEDRLHRLRRAMQIGFVSLAFLEVPVFVVGGVLDWVLDAIERLVPGPLAVEAIEFGAIVVVSISVTVLPIVAAFLGVYPVQRSLRDVEASTGRGLRKFLVGIALGVVPVALWLGVLFVLPSRVLSSTLAVAAAFALFVTVLFAIQPYLVALVADRVPLEGDRRARIERLCADLEFEPRGVYLLEGESTKEANALVAGTVPGLRYVFLTDYLLASCSDAELRAIIAHEYGHVDGYHLPQRGLLTVLTFGAWMLGADRIGLEALEAQFGFLGFFLPFIALMVVYFVPLLGGLALWQEYRADAYAARVAGVDSTVRALEVLADANDMRREAGILYSLLTYHPPVADRIERVREVADADQGA